RDRAPKTNCPRGQLHMTEPSISAATHRPGRMQAATIPAYPCRARRHACKSTNSTVKPLISANEKFAEKESAAQTEARAQFARRVPPPRVAQAIAAIQNPNASPYPLAATR